MEIDRLMENKVVVAILNKDETNRLCDDYKLTMNKVASVDTYPIPRIHYLCVKLSNRKLFTRLDMRHAYE